MRSTEVGVGTKVGVGKSTGVGTGVGDGRAEPRQPLRHQVFHDVHLGLWLTQLATPGLMFVSLHEREVGYLNVRGDGRYNGRNGTVASLDGASLLAAHRLPLACWPNASLATRAAIQSQGEERLFAPRVLPPICSSDDTGFEKWTVRPPKARTCVLRVRPIDPAWRQGFACESSN